MAKSGFSGLLRISKQLSGLRDDAASKVWAAVFTPGIEKITDVRNAVAHGAYLGKTKNGGMVFLTGTSVGSTPKDYGNVSYTLRPSSLIAMAKSLEDSILTLVAICKVEPSRERRYKLHPHPHPKAPPPPARARRKPPRLPSVEIS